MYAFSRRWLQQPKALPFKFNIRCKKLNTVSWLLLFAEIMQNGTPNQAH